RKAIERFEEVEHRLQSPEALGDMAKVTELSRQHKGMLELVEASKRYLETVGDLDGWRTAAQDGSDAELQGMARDEVARLEAELPAMEQSLRFLFIPKDPADERGAVLEIRAGTGGDEASLF